MPKKSCATRTTGGEAQHHIKEVQGKEVEAKLNQLLKQFEQLEAKKTEGKKVPQPEPVKPAKPEMPAADPAMALKLLLMKSSDPKVIALARELLALLEKPTTPKPQAGQPLELEFKIEGLKLQGNKVTPVAPIEGKGGILLMTAPAPAASTLKLSGDGKTAAVVGADGSITIYDVASGKEQLKFPAKK